MSKGNGTLWHPFPRYLLRKKLICRFLKLIDCKGKSILEIGFGAGDMLCCFAKHGMDVYGYDFSELANQEAAERIKINGFDNATMKIFASGNEITPPRGGYDALAAFEVLEHIEDDVGTLKKWHGLLNYNGYIMISVPSRMKKWNMNDVWAGHYRRYEKKELHDKLMQAGFEVIKLWSYPVPINIVLDYFLSKDKRREIEEQKQKNYKKEDMTKESGVKRNDSKIFRMLSNDILMEPWHWMQMLFLNTDLGSGYVVLGKVK